MLHMLKKSNSNQKVLELIFLNHLLAIDVISFIFIKTNGHHGGHNFVRQLSSEYALHIV